jgi:ParB family transcriptional regulator, chromosome partitioning protein
VEEGISVREAEDMAASLNKGKKGATRSGRRGERSAVRGTPEMREIEQKLIEKLGTKVEVRGSAEKGRIEISYFSPDDLERLLQILD